MAVSGGKIHGRGRRMRQLSGDLAQFSAVQMSVSDFPFPAHCRAGSLCGRKVLESVAAESPALSIRLINGSEERSRGYNYMNNDATFDSNLVIILAALLCSLMCALGLSTMVRCALRCNRGLMFESPESVAVRLANTGLKKAAVRALPTVVYGGGSKPQGLGGECPICLAEFVEGDNVRVLPQCNHGFHVGCIDTWLRSHSSCPTCRHNLLAAMEKKRSGAALPTRRAADSSDTSAASSSSLPHSDSTADADVEAGIVVGNPGSAVCTDSCVK